jgi:hypothetical protein
VARLRISLALVGALLITVALVGLGVSRDGSSGRASVDGTPLGSSSSGGSPGGGPHAAAGTSGTAAPRAGADLPKAPPATPVRAAAPTHPAGGPSALQAAAVTPARSPAAAGSATVQGTRKGVSLWSFDGVNGALKDCGASWFYTWSADPAGASAPGVTFVPMIWGAASVTSSNLAKAKANATGGSLLGFNEPDFTSQSNMSVEQALDLWPRLQATGLRLGSPAPATGAATPGGWLDRFLSGASVRGYRVDFIALHWYGGDFVTSRAVDQLRDYVSSTYARYHKPIWLTEYALTDFSGTQPRFPSAAEQASFVTASTAMLSSLPYVERYAWFALPAKAGGPSTGLYAPGAVPNASGLAYRTARS